LIRYLSDFIWKKWLRNYGVKLSGDVSSLRKNAELVLEESASVSAVCMEFNMLTVGAMTYIRGGSELLNVGVIGRFFSIGNGVILGQEKLGHPLYWVSSHPFQFTDTHLIYDGQVTPTKIGHDVWIGRDAMVMEGVNVGTGAVIATRSVVTHDVPPYAIVAGTPAHIIKFRHPPEVIVRLLASEWWDMPVDQLLNYSLNQPEEFLQKIPQIRRANKAMYRTVLIRRQGCREIFSDPVEA
jgi:chloramphenicol O-acetyltransferase type B